MANTKSGFEIRADLLRQAQDILDANHQRQVDSIHASNDVFDQKKPIPSTVLSPSDVIDAGRELYSFVNEK